MKIFPVISLLLMLAVGATAVGGELKSPDTKPTAKKGTIELFGDGSKSTCILDFVSGKYRMSDGNSCKNDYVYGFALHNVPSAATIIFTDSPYCMNDGNFYFQFKTIKYDTSTPEVLLKTIPTFENEAVVVPGLQLIYKFDDEKIEGKLSCVSIQLSD